MNYKNKAVLDEIESFLLNTFKYSGIDHKGNQIIPVIDILERLADLFRHRYDYKKTKITLEEFLNGNIEPTGSELLFTPGSKNNSFTGTPAINLQPQLILFLLLYHKYEYRVIDIIDLFINKIHSNLTVYDFKKTETGVMRCFTNTRFAANTLRDYGLLKFTHKEAYKTWVLSLPGFVVAAELIKNRSWELTSSNEKGQHLHKVIRDSWDKIKDYDDFYKKLKELCKPGVKTFETYEKVLNAAFKNLNEYWAVFKDDDLTGTKRKEKAKELISRIEATADIEKFYRELSLNMNIVELENRQ
jgi:hypothetical protein